MNTMLNTSIPTTRSLLRLTLAGLMASVLAAPVFANEAVVRRAVEARLGNSVKIDSVQVSQIPNLYEVRIGLDIVYVDDKGLHLITGQIQDLKSGRNFTQARVDALATDAIFSEANRKNALKLVKGDGKRVLAVFEDPNCGYCKRLRAEFEKLNNVTIYTYLVPILSEDSATKVDNIWCARDRNKTYDDWMLRGVNPTAAPKNCETPTDAVTRLAQSLKINGTPAMFTAQGQRIPGFVSADKLNQALAGKIVE